MVLLFYTIMEVYTIFGMDSSVLAVSIVAQGVFGGTAGIIVATAAGIITVTYSITDAVHQRNFAERIRIYTIEQYTPYFA